MKIFGSHITLAMVILIHACVQPEDAVDVAVETEALRTAAGSDHEAVEAADLDAFVERNADDILMLPPNEPSAEGRRRPGAWRVLSPGYLAFQSAASP